MPARDPVAIAQHWNSCAPSADALGAPLSRAERAYADGRTYRFTVTLKDGKQRFPEYQGERSIDAWLALFADLDIQGAEPKHIAIDDLTGRFD